MTEHPDEPICLFYYEPLLCRKVPGTVVPGTYGIIRYVCTRLLVVPVHVVEGVQSDFEFRLAHEPLLCRKDTNRYVRTQCTGYRQQHYVLYVGNKLQYSYIR
jgi:hypothetical protein